MTALGSRSDTTTKALRDSIRGCLADLGDSPHTIAGRLHGYGVRGVPGRADDCPMARYLRAVIGPERSVGRIGVLEQRLRVTRRGLHLPFSVALPPPIRSFVRFFDEGQFPDLVDLHGIRRGREEPEGREHGGQEHGGQEAGAAAPDSPARDQT